MGKLFSNPQGFMSDIAPEYGAMLVFAEHRYYGESQPFGEDSLGPDPSKTGYLTSEQSLADHAQLITFLKVMLTIKPQFPGMTVIYKCTSSTVYIGF